jgi:hypothetical protein
MKLFIIVLFIEGCMFGLGYQPSQYDKAYKKEKFL